MPHLSLFAVMTVLTWSCATYRAPSTVVTPAGRAAWYGTQAIKALDLLRDTAINGNAQSPPVFSTDTTRKIVLAHRALVTTIHEAPQGWVQTVETGLTQLLDTLPPDDRAKVTPYVALVQSVLEAVTP